METKNNIRCRATATNKINFFRLLIPAAAIVLIAAGCRGPKVTRTDTRTSGYAQIAADETLMPVVNELLAVFTGLNPEATIDPIYAGENEVIELMMSDSVRLIISTRELADWQLDSLRRMRLRPRSQRLAGDGIALIINPANTDSLIGLTALRDVMTGRITQWSQLSPGGRSNLGEIQVVFDHPNSSTLRFIRDSITRGEPLANSLVALQSNSDVVKHVASNPNALGIVGVNWIRSFKDSTQLEFDPSIRVMSVGWGPEVNAENAFKPFPVFLNNGLYPLRRDIFIIISDSFGTLPSGFVVFAAGDAGQRIILKAGLVPGTRPTREISLQEEE